MKKIFKYPLAESEFQTLSLPRNRKLLSLQMQGETPTMWYLVDTESPKEQVKIRMIGTGWAVEEFGKLGEHIGTVLTSENLVWHYFLVKN